ncbi:adenosine deaminase [Treponema pectinovorum]|uniref:adenosine deaminase n=1 Tax=Treponema pectinovorum TaxID=164 RepID=UPI0011CB444E|nr:adenosine deaminase [Treponema pectinovorum]
MKKSEFYSFYKSIPKAELHIHIEAVISKKSIKKLYLKKNGTAFSDEAMKELFSYSDLNGFIAAFLAIQDLFTEEDDFNLVFEDLKSYLVRNGITHCEAFFAPSAFIKKGFDYEKMAQIFESNIKKIKEETGITVYLLGDVSRTFGPKNAENNLKMFIKTPFNGFIGIGLGGAESKGPAREFGCVFEEALSLGMHAVAHAGEDQDSSSIWDALNICHSQRIGHGISAIKDEKLMEYCAEKQVPFELAPTSNVFTKKYVKDLKSHPFRTFFDRGMLVTLNTDDPLFFDVELLDEYWNLKKEMNFTDDELKQVILNSFKASFLSDDEKNIAFAAVENAWKNYTK